MEHDTTGESERAVADRVRAEVFAQLDAAAAALVRATAGGAIAYFARRAERLVNGEAARVEVAGFLARVPGLVAAAFPSPGDWPHRRPLPAGRFGPGSRPPPLAALALSAAAAELDAILARHGFPPLADEPTVPPPPVGAAVDGASRLYTKLFVGLLSIDGAVRRAADRPKNGRPRSEGRA